MAQEAHQMRDTTLDEGQVDDLKRALALADELCTMVISGRPGQQRAALDVVRMLSVLKRSKTIIE